MSIFRSEGEESIRSRFLRNLDDCLHRVRLIRLSRHKAKVEAAYQLGLNAGKRHIRIAPSAGTDPAPNSSTWVVDGRRFLFTRQMKDQIVRDVQSLASDVKPTRAQWDMILAQNHSTYVIAGAGSGKSTSLILRVVVLHVYLNVPLNEIRVFTFTRESRWDFIGKLRDRMAAWGRPLSEWEATRIVRTFHSMALQMFRQAWDSQARIFEQLDQRNAPAVSTPDDPEAELLDVENPLASDKIGANGKAVLREAYETAFAQSLEFKNLIETLYLRTLVQSREEPESKFASDLATVGEFDAEFSSHLAEEWRQINPDVDIVTGGLAPSLVRLSASHPAKFMVHGYIQAINAHVILGSKLLETSSRPDPWASSKRSRRLRAYIKRKVIAAHSEMPIIWIDTEEDLRRLVAMLAWCNDPKKRAAAPSFSFVPAGEFVKSDERIQETIFSVGQFAENIGLGVIEDFGKIKPDARNAFDAEFARAVVIFWSFFEKTLEEKGIVTFNQIFSIFSERNPQNLKRIATSTLKAMSNLLIDEFQDISPQIVRWIRGCKKALAQRAGETAGSLMCIGDDWQAIYGWRGSSPTFFVKFPTEFPSPNPPQKIEMVENFRSTQAVIDCAESVMRGVGNKIPKHGIAAGSWKDKIGRNEFRRYDRPFPKADIENHIDAELQRIGASNKKSVFLLSRGHKALGMVENGNTTRSKSLTFHGSKGLQARSVILLDDCCYDDHNPLRNALYARAGFDQSYDEAQREEALRLAYVAMTRAEEQFVWFAKPREGGAFNLVQKQP